MDDHATEHGVGIPGAATDRPVEAPLSSPRRSRFALRWFQLARARPGRFILLLAIGVFLSVGVWVLSWRAYAWWHFQAGQRALAADHCSEALTHAQIALRIWPTDGPTLFLAARAARRAGDLDSADYYLSECQRSSAQPDHVEFERILLRACKGQVDAVSEYCEALLEQGHADSPLILEALAHGELTLLRFGAADKRLDRWLARAPDQAHVLFLKGRLQLHANNGQEAIPWLRKSIDLDPERDDVRLLLAGQHLDLGQAQEAVPHLEILVRRQPHNILAKARLAQGLVLLNRTDEARTLLDDVLRLRPDMPLALLERGKLALGDGDLDNAQDWLQKACKREPANKAAQYQLLLCLKKRGNDSEIRTVQARLDQIERDSTRVREIVTDLMPKRPYDADLRAELGELLLRAGALKEGVFWLERAVEAAPRHGIAHRALADYYQSLGQSGLAKQHRALGGVIETGPDPKENKLKK
jgi:tetratricopeptide (TPR) repeat protein